MTLTDDDFDAAVEIETGDWLGMQPPAGGRMEVQKKTRVSTEVPENESFADLVDILEDARVAGTGFEPPRRNARKTALGQESGAESGALCPELPSFDPDLQAIVERWADLPAAVKTGIVAMVKAAV